MIALGRRLDAILADRCLYAEPTHISQRFEGYPSGLLGRTLEITSGARTRRAVLLGNVSGLTSEVERIVTPAGL